MILSLSSARSQFRTIGGVGTGSNSVVTEISSSQNSLATSLYGSLTLVTKVLGQYVGINVSQLSCKQRV
jgi:hypothetical protein